MQLVMTMDDERDAWKIERGPFPSFGLALDMFLLLPYCLHYPSVAAFLVALSLNCDIIPALLYNCAFSSYACDVIMSMVTLQFVIFLGYKIIMCIISVK